VTEDWKGYRSKRGGTRRGDETPLGLKRKKKSAAAGAKRKQRKRECDSLKGHTTTCTITTHHCNAERKIGASEEKGESTMGNSENLWVGRPENSCKVKERGGVYPAEWKKKKNETRESGPVP